MRTLWRSFAGGEITPELYGRLDLTKYQTGLALCQNFATLPHGPAIRRPGFEYINRARDSAHAVKLVPFAFSAAQTVVLEFGHQYVRFHVGGQTLLEANKTVASIAGNVVRVVAHGYSAGDWVYMGRYLQVGGVVDVDHFTVLDLWGLIVTPTGATVARVYTVATSYNAADLFALHYTQSADVLTLSHPSYPTTELRRLGATSWTLTAVSFAPTLAAPTGLAVVPTQPTTGPTEVSTYAVTAVAADGVTESLASTTVSCSNALDLSGNFNTFSWSAVTGATRYNAYKIRGGTLGFIGQTLGLSIVDNNILPDTTKTPPQNINVLNDATDHYPAAVAYHEQRRWLAGTNQYPQNVWATRSGTEANLTSSIPSQDDDGMAFRLAARQQNAILHLLPLADLIALTVGGEFRIFSGQDPAITPTTLAIKPQGYSGASNVQPSLTNNSILYVQAQGSRVRELAYNWQANAYTSIDISIMSPHLFNGYTIADMAFVRAPVPYEWAARSDGTLLGMTYVPEQQVYGWHQHVLGPFDGTTVQAFVESVCVVSEGYEDVLYALVRRTINGQSVRYIERQRSRIFATPSDAFYVDSGLTYNGAATQSIGGLYHLEGQTVQVLTDAAVHPPVKVTGGAIALQYPAVKVQIGLQFTSRLQTLPIVVMGDAAGGAGLKKNVNRVSLRVEGSTNVSAGPGFDRLTEYPSRNTQDNYGSPPALVTGVLRFAIGPSWNDDAGVCVQQDQPLPLNILSEALDYATGG